MPSMGKLVCQAFKSSGIHQLLHLLHFTLIARDRRWTTSKIQIRFLKVMKKVRVTVSIKLQRIFSTFNLTVTFLPLTKITSMQAKQLLIFFHTSINSFQADPPHLLNPKKAYELKSYSLERKLEFVKITLSPPPKR